MKKVKGRGRGLFIRGIPDQERSTVLRAFLGCLIWNGQKRWSVPIETLRERFRNTGGTVVLLGLLIPHYINTHFK